MAGKRILIFTNHFFPENFRVNDVAFDLARKSYQITVLTGIPNYPQGKFYKGYGYFKRRKEVIDNVTVIRIPLIPRGSSSLLRLSLNYISYAFFLTLYSTYIAIKKKFDVILVHHTSPIFLALPAILVKRLQKIKLIFWNLDLWPESVTETTGLKLKLLIKILDKLVSFIYENSDRVLIGSKSFKEPLLNKGVKVEKILYFPNWAEDIFVKRNLMPAELRKYNIPQDSLKIMFAGNIGAAQDMESVVRAIEITSKLTQKVCWIFIGDGRKTDWMKNELLKLGLNKNVFFLGHYPLEFMPSFFSAADAMLVTLLDKPIFSYTAPAKIQTYMASAKPILAMINGEGANIITEANCGLTCNAGDSTSLALNVLKFTEMDVKEREELGKNGFKFYCDYFAKTKMLKQLEDCIEELAI